MKRLLWSLLIGVIVLTGIVALTATTRTGLQLVAKSILPLLPGQISFTELDGRLIGPLSVTGLAWESGEMRLTIGQLDITWQPSRLATRHLYIDSLTASDVHWLTPQTASGDKSNETVALQLPKLPIAITLVRSNISGIQIDNGDSQIPIATLQLAGRIDQTDYVLQEFKLHSDAFDVSASATLSVAAPNDFDSNLSWVARIEEFPTPITGTIAAQGNLDQLTLQVNADGGFDLQLSGLVSDLQTAPQLAGHLDLKKVDPALIGLDATTGDLNAMLDYDITADGISFDGKVLAPGLLPGAAIIRADSKLTGDTLRLDELRLQIEGRPTVVDVTGTMLTDLSELNLELKWADLVWPLDQTDGFSSPNGIAKLTGSIESYQLAIRGAMADGVLPAAQVSLSGQGTTRQFEIADMEARFAEGSINARGMLQWADMPEAHLEIVSRDLDLSQWNKQLEGRLGFAGSLVASLPSDGPHASIQLQTIDGQLRGNTLSGSGAVNYAPGLIGFRKFDLRAGPARIEADGHIGEELDLRWDLNVPDFGLFIPGGSGLLRSQGKATGKPSQPGLAGNLSLEAVQIGQFAAARADGRFDIDVATASVSLDASGIKLGPTSIGNVRVIANGTVAQHVIDFEINGPTLTLESTFDGGFTAGAWRGNVAKLNAGRNETGVWSLPAMAALTIERERIALAQTCLVQRDSQLCFDGDLAANGPWRTQFDLIALPIDAFAPFLPPGLIYEGFISGTGHVASAATAWDGNVDLKLSNGRVVSRENDEEDVLIAFENGSVETRFDPARIEARVKLDLRDAGAIDANIIVPTDAGQLLQGTIQARVENLSMVTALVPQVGRIDGQIAADLVLSGTQMSPDLSGQIDLKATEVVLPDLGITLNDAVVAVVSRGTGLRFDGSASSGPGQASLSGELVWQQGGPRGQLSLNGEQFRAIDLPEIQLDASPSLTLSVDGRDLQVAGNIDVPAARITPIDFSTGIAVSPDQVIVGDEAPADAASAWQINASVEVTAGDNVHIDAYGLEGNLAGAVRIIEAPDQPTIGRGALEVIDGRYSAYGQELKIETGRLEFTGGYLDDPGLNLLATRTAGDVVAGVQVRGALRNPVLTLYSVPAMADTQAMSYLITGRGLEDLNEFDQTAVTDAATRLALRGGSYLASSLGRELGLDSVEIEDDGAAASTTLVVGKHLSPRLFVSYGIGLFEAINTLRLRYRINSRFTLETQSGVETSADLLYSMER